jgi:GNAT superfamily N-acetyltransferase
MFQDLTRELAIARMPFLLSLTADMDDWPPWTEEQFLHELPDKWILSFVSDKGVAIMSRRDIEHVHLHLLAVAPNARGTAVGSAFIEEIKARVQDRIFTLKVPKDSRGAVTFYQRHGFQADGEATGRWMGMKLVRQA